MASFNSNFERNNDINLVTDIDSIVSKINIYRDNVEQHACNQCPKVYKAIRGLNRHIASKHILENLEKCSFKMYNTENSSKKLSQLKLKNIVEECASLLEMDMCLAFDKKTVLMRAN